MGKLKSVLIIGLILILLASCSKAPAKHDEAGGDQTKASPSSDEKVTITLSSWRTEEVEAFKILNKKFEEEFPNITIKYDPIKDTEYDSVLNTALETGSAADMYYVRPFDLGLNLYKANHLLKLTDDMVPNLQNINETQKVIYEDSDGSLFAAPYIYVAYGFLYNKKIFEENNLQEPKTWDEFFRLLEQLKAKGITPLAMGTKDPWVLTEVVSYGNYANFVGGEDWRKQFIAGKAKTTDQGFVDFLTSIQKWSNYLPKNFTGIGYIESQQLFLSDQAAIFPSGSWEIGNFHNQNPDMEMGFFPAPVVNKGDKQWVGFNGGAGIGVNPKTPHKDAVLTYINWLLSEEGQIMTGNEMAGLFPCLSSVEDQIEDPLAKAWLQAGGASGENFAIGWGLQKVNEGSPGAGQLASDNLPLLLKGDKSPQEVAETIQKGIDSWYQP